MKKHLQPFIVISIADIKGAELLATGAIKLVAIAYFDKGEMKYGTVAPLRNESFVQRFLEDRLAEILRIYAASNTKEKPHLVHNFSARELDNLFHTMQQSKLFNEIKSTGIVDLNTLLFLAGYSDYNDYTYKNASEIEIKRDHSKAMNIAAVYMALISKGI